MKKRISIRTVTPEAYQPLIDLEKYIAKAGIDRKMYHLIKTRASQLNGCHYCINMHTRDAMKEGETAQRLFLLDAWWEATELYTEKELLAIELTEAMTFIAQGGVSDDLYNRASEVFSEKELSTIMMAIVAINSWNRLAIATKQELD